MPRLTDPYHEGELAVQKRMGEELQAVVNAANIRSTADQGTARNLAQANIAAITTRLDGQLHVDVCSGPTGFTLLTSASHVRFSCDHTLPGTLIAGIEQGGLVGGVTLGFVARQRARVNGAATIIDEFTFDVDADEVFFNCTKFISTRSEINEVITSPGRVDTGEFVARADMFFIGSHHPERGLDASHRGGNPGFVNFDGASLSWNEYPGNAMYQTMGNLIEHPEIAVVVPDLITGRQVHFHGKAKLTFDAGLAVTVEVDSVEEGDLAFTRRWQPEKLSPHNPPISDVVPSG